MSYNYVKLVICVVVSANAAIAQLTTRVSVNQAGVEGDSSCFSPNLTPDARVVAFSSNATNLIAGDTNGMRDVFVVDRVLSTIERASQSSSGIEANDVSEHVSVSDDGRFVLFASAASNLVAGDTNNTWDIFLRDRQLGVLERVNVSTVGTQANGDSRSPCLSGNGRFVAFASVASNLVAADTNVRSDVFVRDLQTGITERVSLATSGAQPNADCRHTSISDDGRFIAFESFASNLAPGDTSTSKDIFVRDQLLQVTERISVALGGGNANGQSGYPVLSADGRFVAFSSDASNLVASDINGTNDVFVVDRQSWAVELVSVSEVGIQGVGHSAWPSISQDGRFVAFSSSASNLVPNDTNSQNDVFLRDRLAGTLERVSVGTTGGQGNAGSYMEQVNFNTEARCISSDGRSVAFLSSASSFVTGDSNGHADVFVRERFQASGTFCDGSSLSADHTTPCPCGNSGATGNGCGHSFDRNGANLSASGAPSGDDVVLRSQFEPVTSFTLFMQHDAGGDSTFHDGVLCAGGSLIRLRGRGAVAGEAFFPNSNFANDSTTTLSQRGLVTPGSGARRYYAAWYRNASTSFCPPATANVTNGWIIDW